MRERAFRFILEALGEEQLGFGLFEMGLGKILGRGYV